MKDEFKDRIKRENLQWRSFPVFEINVKETNQEKAKSEVEEMCKKLLANLVIENYKIIETQ